MRVFIVRPDTDHFQWFQTEQGDLSNTGAAGGQLDCTRRAATWIAPKVYIPHPELKQGDFSDLNRTGQLVLSTELRCRVAAEGFFLDAGELLPLEHQGKQYTLLNVVSAINCLKHQECQWSARSDTGTAVPVNLVFYPDRFQYSSIFKIPELRTVNLVLERDGDPENEFKAAYELSDLTGLKFELLWEG